MKIYLNYTDKNNYIENYSLFGDNDIPYNRISKDVDSGLSTRNITKRIGLMGLSNSTELLNLFNSLDYGKILDICGCDNTNVWYSTDK